MGRDRLEAFTDGVIAILITIMVLELRIPHGTDLSALTPVLPVFPSDSIGFVFCREFRARLWRPVVIYV